MKKVLSWALIAAMAASLLLVAGCSSDNGDSTPQDSSGTVAPDTSGTDASDADVAPEPEVPEYTRGVSTATGFESEWLGIRYTAPAGYVMATEEELLENAQSAQSGADADGASTTAVHEMMSYAPAGTPHLLLMTDELPLASMPLESYLEILSEQLTSTDTITMTSTEPTTVQIASQDYEMLAFSNTTGGFEVLQELYLCKIADRMCLFTLTYTAETAAEAATLLTAIQPY